MTITEMENFWSWVYWKQEGLRDVGWSGQGLGWKFPSGRIHACCVPQSWCHITHTPLDTLPTWIFEMRGVSCGAPPPHEAAARRRRGSYLHLAGKWCQIAPPLSHGPSVTWRNPACAACPTQGLGTMEGCGTRNNDHHHPQQGHILIPRTCEYVTLHGRRDFAGVSKLRILRWGEYSGISRWSR